MKLPFLRARQPPAKPASSWGGLIAISSAWPSSCPPQAEPKAGTPWPTARLASLKGAFPLGSLRFWLEICFVGQGLSKPQEQSSLEKKKRTRTAQVTHIPDWSQGTEDFMNIYTNKRQSHGVYYSSQGITKVLRLHCTYTKRLSVTSKK